MAEDGTYHVKIEGQGVVIERDVTKDIGDRLIVLLMTGKPTSPAASRPPLAQNEGAIVNGALGAASEDFEESPEISLREYIDQHNAKRNPDMITAMACYMNELLDKKLFNSGDLTAAFRAAAEPVPRNMARDIKWAVRVGWIAPAPNKTGVYYITKTGRDAVGASFPPNVIKKTKVATGKKKSPKAGAKA